MTRRAWSFLTLHETQYAGNEGYPDELGESYAYDSAVQNSANVQVGDVAVLRDSDRLLGVGRIDGIESEATTKVRERCPNCSLTGHKRRATMTPAYRCPDCKHEFDEPTSEVVDVIGYTAHYGPTWQPSDGSILRADIEAVTLGNARQHAIREVDPVELEGLLLSPLPPPTEEPKPVPKAGVEVLPVGEVSTVAYRISSGSPTTAHRLEAILVLDYASFLADLGRTTEVHRYVTAEGAGLYCDLYDATAGALIEAKQSATRENVRMAIGQLLDYDRYEDGTPTLAVLTPDRPAEDMLELLVGLEINAIWRDANSGFQTV